jgi:hypothetical protein
MGYFTPQKSKLIPGKWFPRGENGERLPRQPLFDTRAAAVRDCERLNSLFKLEIAQWRKEKL